MGKVNENDLEWTDLDQQGMCVRRKQLGEAAGGQALGCSLYQLPAGERSWPYHYHTANEEAIFVLGGEGTLRTEDGERALRSGDFVTLPADESGGHQLHNDGDDPLRYLAVSTMNEPDVTIYPEMEKVGVFVGAPPGGRSERPFHGYYSIDDDVDYWEDE